MLNLQTIVNTTQATCIESEVSMLLQKSIERIDSRSIAAHMFSEWINQLPKIATGTYSVLIKDDFDQPMEKHQEWNDALWLIGLSLLTEFKALNSYNVAGALAKWSMDMENCMYELKQEEAQQLGEWVIIGMQQQHWLMTTPSESVDIVDGQARKVKKFKCTPQFLQATEFARLDLVEKTHMNCQPLRHKPQPWTDNVTGVAPDAKLKLVKGRSKKQVAKHAILAANRAQSVPYEVHPDISMLAGIVVDNEMDFRKALGYDSASKKSKWEGVFEQWKEIAKLPVEVPLYFPVTYDFRGRMYYRGGIVSPQGSDCCKAAFAFNTGYPLGKTGFAALCVGLATAMGSKESVKVKVQQVQQSAADIVSYANDVNDFRKFCARFKNADKCQAWLLARELGRVLRWVDAGNKVEDFISNVPVHQDGTCSGLQHISVITRDLATAKAVNMTAATHDDKPADVYTDIIVNANQRTEVELTRDVGKPVVMLGGYGAGENTIKSAVYEEIGDLVERVWPELEVAMAEVAPALMKFTNAVHQRAEKAVGLGAVSLIWKTYDGFEVEQQYVDNSANLFFGKTYSGHLNRYERTLDSRKMVTATSPNLIHSNDSCHLRLAVTTSRMDVSLVHDSYGTHACNYFAFNHVLRKVMHEMYTEYDMLADFSTRNQVPNFNFLDNGYKLDMMLNAVNCFG